MKKLFFAIIALAVATSTFAQSSPLQTIPIGVVVSENPVVVPDQAQASLQNKLFQIVTANGLGASDRASFYLTCRINIVDKQVLGTAPTKVVQTADLTFYVVDAQTNRIHETLTITAKGVGQNDNQSLISALKNVKPQAPEIKSFMSKASNEIISYYEAKINEYVKMAQSYAMSGEFESALYLLASVPEACPSYSKVSDAAIDIYQKMIDNQSHKMLQKAKLIWATGHSYEAAIEAGEYLAEVSVYSSYYDEAEALAKEIKAFVISEHAYEREQQEEALAWERKMELRRTKLEEKAIDAWKSVGVAYGENQPQTIYNVNWLY